MTGSEVDPIFCVMTEAAYDARMTTKAEAEIIQWTRMETNLVWILRIGATIVAALVWLAIQTYNTNAVLSGHSEVIGAIQSDVISIQSDVASLQSNVISLQSDVASLQSNVISLQSDVASLQSEIAAMQITQSAHSESLARIEAILNEGLPRDR